MNSRQRGILFPVLLVLLLVSACSDDEPAPDQRYYFLESLQQVESGGRQLQSAGLDQQRLAEALEMLDQGLRLSFEVRRDFLDELDLRLGKNYQRYFIAGVENYRVGIEAGDEAQQREGLRLLARWAEFWRKEREAILARMDPA